MDKKYAMAVDEVGMGLINALLGDRVGFFEMMAMPLAGNEEMAVLVTPNKPCVPPAVEEGVSKEVADG